MAGFHNRADDLVALHVIPYPAFTLVIDLSDELLVEDASGTRRRGSIIAGVAPGSVYGHGRHIECLQLRLSPAAARELLGDSSDLGERVVGLEEFWGRDAIRIQERLRDANSWDARFALAEAALARRRDERRGLDPEVSFAWEHIVKSRGQARVEHLAREIGWSRKRLWSRFGSQVGLTPKRASRLVRFDHAAHRLAAGGNPAAVAAESGYADQSHLHRDVMDFAAVTPSALAAAPWLAVDHIAWPSNQRSRS
jgi:AraC-like DNA-binding protein